MEKPNFETEREKEIWRIAKKRVGFKKHLSTYIIVNAMLWCIWWFSGGTSDGEQFPWPVWPLFGWGIGVAFDYVDAYHSNRTSAIEKEYEKLKKERE